MSSISATGLGVRHAVSRALATANLAPHEATYKVISARVDTDSRQRVIRADVSVRIRAPEPLLDPLSPEQLGWVNPDGRHPLMSLVHVSEKNGLRPIYLDIYPVCWDRWLQVMEDTLPETIEPYSPVANQPLDKIAECLELFELRLPTLAEFRAAWGVSTFPWGAEPNPGLGRVLPPRYQVLPSVGLHPPTAQGHHDLGAWLWQLLQGELVAGSLQGKLPVLGLSYDKDLSPIGFRCVADPL